MILTDSSIWIDHLRLPSLGLSRLLARSQVLMHPFVIGEIALGSIKNRDVVISQLSSLPSSDVATHGEIMRFVERHQLFGHGIGYVDVHLLAATLLGPGMRLWTRDKRLLAAAEQLGIAAEPMS